MNYAKKMGRVLDNKDFDVIAYTDGKILFRNRTYKKPTYIFGRKLYQKKGTKQVYFKYENEEIFLPLEESEVEEQTAEAAKKPDTIKKGLDKIKSFDGEKYTEERYKKLEEILSGLPCYPMKDHFGYTTVLHVEEGWFTRIAIDINDNKQICVYMDGDNLDPSETRVKTTEEVLALTKEYHEIKDATDIDAFWQMTDDPREFSRMSQIDDNAKRRRREILLMLQ
ncbi:hypothetical protein CN918_29105 [Priestia megaterium]|nr:hypothetical protein CN918_29105 [Priestia megaterium]